MSMAAVVTTQVAGSGTLVPATKKGSWSDVAGGACVGGCARVGGRRTSGIWEKTLRGK